MEDQKKEITKGRKTFWLIFDIIFLGVYFSYFVLLLDLFGLIRFYDGYHETKIMLRLLFFPVTHWYLCVLLVFLIIFRFSDWKKYCAEKSKLKVKLSILMCAVVIFNPLVAFMIPTPVIPNRNPFLQGFHQRMSEDLEIEKIRAWMKTLEDEIYDGTWRHVEEDDLYTSSILDEVVPIDDNVSNVVLYKEGRMRMLRIEWGGGLMSWGLEIAIEDSDISIPQVYEENKTMLKLDDGAYVYVN